MGEEYCSFLVGGRAMWVQVSWVGYQGIAFSGCLVLISLTLHWSEGHSGSLLACPLDLQLMQNRWWWSLHLSDLWD